jgi:hypothetical protein
MARSPTSTTPSAREANVDAHDGRYWRVPARDNRQGRR